VTRVCLDSNVLVAAFAARGLCADLLRLVLAEHHLVVPECVAEEVRRTLTDKLKVRSEALEAVDAVLVRCEIIPVGTGPPPIRVRDPDDERVLADAVAGGAEILVTGDNDLLDVAAASPIRIMSPRAFMTLVHGTKR
jgi:putative PIN family toxin of toxin-antitoxin system